jgi:hypothetical protein
MFCAFIHPTVSKWLAAIEEMQPVRRTTVRVAVLAVVGALFTIYYNTIYSLPKREYNSVSMILLFFVKGKCVNAEAGAVAIDP